MSKEQQQTTAAAEQEQIQTYSDTKIQRLEVALAKAKKETAFWKARATEGIHEI